MHKDSVLFEDVPEDGVIWRRSRGDEHQPEVQEGEVEKKWVFWVSSICRSYSGTFLQKTWDFKLDKGQPEIVWKQKITTNQPTNLPTNLPEMHQPTACSTNQLLQEIPSQRAKGNPPMQTHQAIEKIDLPPPWEKRRVRAAGDRWGDLHRAFRVENMVCFFGFGRRG